MRLEENIIKLPNSVGSLQVKQDSVGSPQVKPNSIGSPQVKPKPKRDNVSQENHIGNKDRTPYGTLKRNDSTSSHDSNISTSSVDSNNLPFANENESHHILCLSQARTWISNVICCALSFNVQ
jgi:hypothetical protein